jgi:hypothetical protein
MYERRQNYLPGTGEHCGPALPFGAGEVGPEPREAVECTSANAAIRSAERMAQAEGNIGAVAFSRNGDPGSGEFADAVLLKAFSEVPRDLSES